MNIPETAKPVTAESLYRSKKGIKKNAIVIIAEPGNNIHKTKGWIWKYHCKIIPAIKGTRKRMNGAFFQICMTGDAIHKR